VVVTGPSVDGPRSDEGSGSGKRRIVAGGGGAPKEEAKPEAAPQQQPEQPKEELSGDELLREMERKRKERNKPKDAPKPAPKADEDEDEEAKKVDLNVPRRSSELDGTSTALSPEQLKQLQEPARKDDGNGWVPWAIGGGVVGAAAITVGSILIVNAVSKPTTATAVVTWAP